MKKLLLIILLFATSEVRAHFEVKRDSVYPIFVFKWSGGVGTYIEKGKLNYGILSSPLLAFHLTKGFYLETAPVYTYYFRWKEYFLNFPLHVKKQFKSGLSVFAGPCITWDVPALWSIGISGGISYQVGKYSALCLTTNSHSLYRYAINYLILPVSLSYQHTIWPYKKKVLSNNW